MFLNTFISPPFWEVLFLAIFIKLTGCGYTAKQCIRIQRSLMCANHLLHLLNFLSWYRTWFQFVKWYFRKFFLCLDLILTFTCLYDLQDELCNHVFPFSCWIFYDPGIVQISSWEEIPDLCAELLNTCFIYNWYCCIFLFWISPTVLYSLPSNFTVMLRIMNAFCPKQSHIYL